MSVRKVLSVKPEGDSIIIAFTPQPWLLLIFCNGLSVCTPVTYPAFVLYGMVWHAASF